MKKKRTTTTTMRKKTTTTTMMRTTTTTMRKKKSQLLQKAQRWLMPGCLRAGDAKGSQMHQPLVGKTLEMDLQKRPAKTNVSQLHPANSLCSRMVVAVASRPATRTIKDRRGGKLGRRKGQHLQLHQSLSQRSRRRKRRKLQNQSLSHRRRKTKTCFLVSLCSPLRARSSVYEAEALGLLWYKEESAANLRSQVMEPPSH